MREEKITADRLTAFSDAVFAVIVTIMVLELKAPDEPAFSALWPLWPTAISNTCAKVRNRSHECERSSQECARHTHSRTAGFMQYNRLS
jgi:hypothetical protein